MNKPPRLDPRVDPSTPLPRPPVPALRPKALPPDEKPTVELDGIEILKGMLREVGENMRAEFRVTNANIDSLSYEVIAIKGRVGSLEEWRANEERRALRHSERVAALDERTSSNDLSHEATIAIIQTEVQATKAKVDSLETKVDTVLVDVGLMAKSVNSIVASPKAKMVASAIVAWLLGYLASKGIILPALQ